MTARSNNPAALEPSRSTMAKTGLALFGSREDNALFAPRRSISDGNCSRHPAPKDHAGREHVVDERSVMI